MKRFYRAAIKWGAANLFAVLPVLYIISGIFPDQLTCQVKALDEFSVEASVLNKTEDRAKADLLQRASHSGKSEIQNIVLCLSGNVDMSNLRVEMKTRAPEIEIGALHLIKRGIISYSLDLNDVAATMKRHGKIKNVVQNDNRLIIMPVESEATITIVDGANNKWTIDSPFSFIANMQDKLQLIITSALFIFELGLFFLSYLMTFTKPDDTSKKEAVVQSSLVALAISAFYVVVLPMQSYLVNRADFKFTFDELLCEVGCEFMVGFVVCTALLYLLNFFWGRFFHVLFTFVVLYEYLETGILAIGQPPLNGEIQYFSNVGKRIFDFAVLLGVVGVGTVFWVHVKRFIHWVALIVTVMSIVSLFDVHADERNSVSLDNTIINNFCSKHDVAQSVRYSKQRNVLVFVLDMVTSEVAEDVLRQDSDLRSKFKGFTCYRNNVGMHMCTDVGTAGLMTGQYFTDPLSLTEYVYSIFSSNSVLAAYGELGVPTYCIPGSMVFGYTNKPESADSGSIHDSGLVKSPLEWRMEDQQRWNLSEIVKFRATPFWAKPFVYYHITNGWPFWADISDESELFPYLASAKVEDDYYLTFHWYHTIGCHPPLNIDRNGHSFGAVRWGYAAHLEKTWHALRLLGNLFDIYRNIGIYDNSLIVVCADHGAAYENGKALIQNGLPPKALPMLWVKPSYSNGECMESEMPTTHANIASLLRCAVSCDLDISQINKILACDDRLFREAAGKGLWDWHVDATGSVNKVEYSLSRDISSLKPVLLDYPYLLNPKLHGERADLLYENVDWSGAGLPRVFSNVQSAIMRLRAPDANCMYRIQLQLRTMLSQTGGRMSNASPTSGLEISANGARSPIVGFNEDEMANIEIKGIRPNNDGLIEIRIDRNGMVDQYFLQTLTVRKM